LLLIVRVYFFSSKQTESYPPARSQIGFTANWSLISHRRTPHIPNLSATFPTEPSQRFYRCPLRLNLITLIIGCSWLLRPSCRRGEEHLVAGTELSRGENISFARSSRTKSISICAARHLLSSSQGTIWSPVLLCVIWSMVKNPTVVLWIFNLHCIHLFWQQLVVRLINLCSEMDWTMLINLCSHMGWTTSAILIRCKVNYLCILIWIGRVESKWKEQSLIWIVLSCLPRLLSYLSMLRCEIFGVLCEACPNFFSEY
jgi:hypothetical protein